MISFDSNTRHVAKLTISQQIAKLEHAAQRKEKRYARVGASLPAPSSEPKTLAAKREYVRQLDAYLKTRGIKLRHGDTVSLSLLERTAKETARQNAEKLAALNALRASDPVAIDRELRMKGQTVDVGKPGVIGITRRPGGGVINEMLPVRITQLPATKQVAEKRLEKAQQHYDISVHRSANRESVAKMLEAMGRADTADAVREMGDKAFDIFRFNEGGIERLAFVYHSDPNRGEMPPTVEVVGRGEMIDSIVDNIEMIAMIK